MDAIMRERSRIVKPFSNIPLRTVPTWRRQSPFPVPVRHRDPYTLPKSKIGAAMTIGAAFRCKDGAVLCADTQMSWEGWHKRRGSKITLVSDVENPLFFLQADIVSAGRNLIGRLTKALRSRRVSSLGEMEKLFRKTCNKFREEEERCPELLVAVMTKNRVVLYEVDSEFRVTPVDRAAYIGSGGGVIDRIDESYFTKKMSVRQATFVAVYAAKEAKDFGDRVGRSTQIVQIFDTGSWRMIQEDEIERLEKDYVKAQELIGKLLTVYTPLFMPESKEFKANLKRLTSHLRRAYKNRGHLAAQQENEEINRQGESLK